MYFSFDIFFVLPKAMKGKIFSLCAETRLSLEMSKTIFISEDCELMLIMIMYLIHKKIKPFVLNKSIICHYSF